MYRILFSGLGLASLAAATFGSSPPVVLAPTHAALVAAQTTDVWPGLTASFAEATAEWDARYDATVDRDERRAMRAATPAADFWPRFTTLADAGEARALNWLIQNARAAGHRGRTARTLKAGLYARLIPTHVDEPWFGDVVASLASDRRAVGDETFVSYLEAAGRAKLPEVAARSMVVLGSYLVGTRDDEQVARGWQLIEGVITSFPDTEAAAEAENQLFVERNLKIGAIAPDFDAATIDGDSLSLSQFRGNVVVLDFFGFW